MNVLILRELFALSPSLSYQRSIDQVHDLLPQWLIPSELRCIFLADDFVGWEVGLEVE